MAVVVSVTGKWDGSELAKAQNQFGAFRRDVERQMQGAGASMVRVGDQLRSVGSKMSQTGRDLTRNVSLPLVGLGFVATRAASTFETQMTTVQQASGATGKQMEQLRTLAGSFATTMGTSASDAADAMVELTKAGMTPAQQAAGALEAAMSLATTQGLSLSDAATVITNSMAAFNLEAKDAAAITDTFTAGANASTASVDSLRQGFSQVAAGAKNAGLSLNDTVGALALFDQAGVKGSDAGTSLKTMLARLVPQTRSAGKAFDMFGVSFVKADGQFKSLAQVAQILHDKFGKMSQAQRQVAFNTMFGSDATRAATILMRSGADGLNKYIDATKKAGSTEAALNAQRDTTAFKLKQAKAAVTNAAIELGSSLAPAVQSASESLADLANGFSRLSPGTRDLIVKAGLLAVAMGPVLRVTGALTTGVGTAVKGVGRLGIAFKTGGASSSKFANLVAKAGMGAKQAALNFVSGFRSSQSAASAFSGRMGSIGGAVRSSFTTIGSAAATAGKAIGSAMLNAAKAVGAAMMSIGRAMMANPWILAVAAVIAAVVLIVKNWDKVKGFLLASWRVIKQVAGAVWGRIRDVVVGVWHGIVRTAHVVWGAFTGYFRTQLAIYKAIFTGAWNAIKGVVLWVWRATVAGIRTYINIVKGIIHGVMSTISGIWEKAWTGMKDFVVGVWDGITGAAKGAINLLIDGINVLIRGINRVRFTVPDIPGVPHRGESFGVSVSEIPRLAKGAIIPPTRGGRLAVVGEGRHAEAVIPLTPQLRRGGMGGVTVAAGAVQVNIDAAGADRSSVPAIKRAAEQAASAAFDRLLVELRTA